MKIILENIGKHFNNEWIFRHVDYTLSSAHSYAVLGANGMGKSTLLQLITGHLSPAEGKIIYLSEHETIPVEVIFKYVSLAAPYLDLIEEFTLEELLQFHFKFKQIKFGWDIPAVINLLKLEYAATRPLKYFSSGMRQRVKLALACCSDTPILLLDEPTTNLDQEGQNWYLSLIEQFSLGRLTIVCSNQAHEYQFCTHQILLDHYKGDLP